MARPTTLLRIPQPCPESWDAMTPNTAGRHCAACQKTVIDFSLKSDVEILAYFTQQVGASTCGRFRTNQLARPLAPAAPDPARHNWRPGLAALLTLWGLRAEASTPVGTSQTAPTHHTPRPQAKMGPAARPLRPTRRLGSGMVRDAYTQKPLPNVRVRLAGSTRATLTDRNGYFSLWLPAEHQPRTTYTLKLHLPGYQARTISRRRGTGVARIDLQALPGYADFPDLGLYTSGTPMMEDFVVSAVPVTPPTPTSPTVAPVASHHFFSWFTRLFRRSQPVPH